MTRKRQRRSAKREPSPRTLSQASCVGRGHITKDAQKMVRAADMLLLPAVQLQRNTVQVPQRHLMHRTKHVIEVLVSIPVSSAKSPHSCYVVILSVRV